MLAVQGPRSAEVLAALNLPTDMEYMAYADAELVVDRESYPVRVVPHRLPW